MSSTPDPILHESFVNLGLRLGAIIGPAIADNKVEAVVEDLVSLSTQLAEARAPNIARAFLMAFFSALEGDTGDVRN
ncbi:MAG: hypothetical protein ACJ8LG_21580 [Massilia sp.]